MAFPVDRDHRFFAPWHGVVIDNQDPRGLHRVKVRIPALIEESQWAYPRTTGGGSRRQGGHIVPPVGAFVIVEFLGGDEERPIYQPAWWGDRPATGSDAPESIVEAGSEGHLVQALQLGDLLFTVDERPRDIETGTGQQFTVRDLKADKVVMTYDLAQQGWSIESDYLIQIKSTGLVSIEGLQVAINGRLVRNTGRQI